MMNHIDRLITKAVAKSGSRYLGICMIWPNSETGTYDLRPGLWGAKPGEQIPDSIHASRKAVEDRIEELKQRYSVGKMTKIIWIHWGRNEDN